MKHQQWPLLFDSSWGGRGEGGNPGRAGNPTGINGWHQPRPAGARRGPRSRVILAEEERVYTSHRKEKGGERKNADLTQYV